MLETLRERIGLPLWLPAAVTLALWALGHFDVLGFAAASHERSEQATLRIGAPFYEASNRVVAVVIDDDYLRARSLSWPLSYVEQGGILRRLLSVEPAVLVVDFVYPHRHADRRDGGSEPIDGLTKPIESNATIPVIFTALAQERGSAAAPVACSGEPGPARGVDDLLDATSIDPDLHRWLERPLPTQSAPARQLAFIGWSGCGDRYPLLLARNPAAPTPAFAAYRAFCAGHDSVASCSRGAPSTRTAAFARPMILRAGAFPPAAQVFAFGATCQRTVPPDGQVSLPRRLWSATRQFAFSLFGEPRDNRDTEISLPCPAVTVVPYSLLIDASPKEWRELLGGKAVFLGANLAGIPDLVQTPVHGQIAGVIWHAMALDNLLAYGDRYLADSESPWGTAIKLGLMLVFAYSFPLAVHWYEHERTRRALVVASVVGWSLLTVLFLWHGDTGKAGLALALGACLDLVKPTYSAGYLFGLGIVAVIAVFVGIAGSQLGNWIGLVLGVAGFAHAMKGYYRPSNKSQLPHPLSVLYRTFKLGVRRVA